MHLLKRQDSLCNAVNKIIYIENYEESTNYKISARKPEIMFFVQINKKDTYFIIPFL